MITVTVVYLRSNVQLVLSVVTRHLHNRNGNRISSRKVVRINSASEVTTLRRYTNLFIIIIIIF